MLDPVADVIPRFGFRVRAAVACEQGIRRDVLQDGFLIDTEHGAFAIADGMGGHQAGEVASREALQEVREAIASAASLNVARRYFERPDLASRRCVMDRLRRVVERAHEHVRRIAKDGHLLRDMGTTLEVLWLIREEVFLAHVGDSRAYVIRPAAVLQLTEDHTMPLGTASDTAPGRHALTSLVHAVGVGDSPRIDTVMLDLRRGDRLLLATDGVWASFDDEAALGQVGRTGDAREAANALVAEAIRNGSADDRTALVVEILERFARQSNTEADVAARDITPVAECALFHHLSWAKILSALSIAVHVEFEPGEDVPHFAAGDRVAYIVLDGTVRTAEGRILGSGATLFAECLVGSEPATENPRCELRVRTLRIRRDDYHEICRSDPHLAVELYRRLAEHLGQRLGK